MNDFLTHIAHIALSIIALVFSSCNTPALPDDIENFSKNRQKNDEILENLAYFTDSCTPKRPKNYAFFEKKSEIFLQKGINECEKKAFSEAADDIFTALESEKTALRLKDETENDDLHYLGRIYESIGDIYNKVNSLKPASYFYNEALTKFEEASRHHEVIDMLLKIGDLYQSNHIPDIALLNYETAEERRNLTDAQLCDILTRKGIALYDISDTETADSLYGILSTKSLQNIEFHYFTACHFYYGDDIDEALPHLLFCFENGNNSVKINVAEMLADVYFRLDDRNNELNFAQYQARATSADARLTPTRMELETRYEKYLTENSGKNDVKAIRNNKALWIVIIATLLIFVGIATTYFISKHKKEKIIDDKVKIINDISKKLEDVSNVAKSRSFDDDYNIFKETKIFKEIKESLEGKVIMTKTVGDYPEIALSKTKIVTLTTKFNECFPNLIHVVSEAHPDLTQHDFRNIIFNLMGLSSLEIAILLQQTYSSTNKREKHIKSVLGTEEPLEHFLPNYLRTVKY